MNLLLFGKQAEERCRNWLWLLGSHFVSVEPACLVSFPRIPFLTCPTIGFYCSFSFILSAMHWWYKHGDFDGSISIPFMRKELVRGSVQMNVNCSNNSSSTNWHGTVTCLFLMVSDCFGNEAAKVLVTGGTVLFVLLTRLVKISVVIIWNAAWSCGISWIRFRDTAADEMLKTCRSGWVSWSLRWYGWR